MRASQRGLLWRVMEGDGAFLEKRRTRCVCGGGVLLLQVVPPALEKKMQKLRKERRKTSPGELRQKVSVSPPSRASVSATVACGV